MVSIDVSPIDSTQEAEVERLLALGARYVDIGQGQLRSGRGLRPWPHPYLARGAGEVGHDY